MTNGDSAMDSGIEPDFDPALLEFLSKTAALMQLPAEATSLYPLPGGGSARRIYRVCGTGLPLVVVTNPLPEDRSHPDENESFVAVEAFLERRGVRVPRFYAADLERGFVLLEDLGDERLFDRVRRTGWPAMRNRGAGDARNHVAAGARTEENPAVSDAAMETFGLYRQAIDLLILMQRPGPPCFRLDWVFNPPYTADFILEMESGYFHREFVRAWLARELDFGILEKECRWLAETAIGDSGASREAAGDCRDAAAPPTPPSFRFLHRDYQSRNLMIVNGALAVIDFQGARLGPPEYDLAALLYDPYVAMPQSVREELIDDYLRKAAAAGGPEGWQGAPLPAGAQEFESDAGRAWRRRFLANAANRLMQALGAFGKLGARLGKPGYLEHAPVALAALEGVLAELACCERLRETVGDLRRREAE